MRLFGNMKRRVAPLFFALLLTVFAGGCKQSENSGEETGTAIAVPTQLSQPIKPSSDLQYFTNCAFRTGQNAIIGITAETAIDGDLSLEPGDEIAVYTSDGTVCAGASLWTGSNIAITAWGDNSQTDAIDGMQDGENLQFRIWDSSAGREFVISEAAFAEGNGRYQTDGIYVVAGLQLGQP